jgi:serine/threonine-protein kinase
MSCPSCRAENDEGARVCVSCRTPLRVVSAGSVVAERYEIRQTIGRGGMGTVYRAHDRALDEEVALKILRADLVGSPGMAARFRSEIKLARRVSHWNVCRIYEYGEDAGLQYISMELVAGETLKQRLNRIGPLPPESAFDVAAQVAEGLAAVHKAGIVHRDLKTPNIMVDDKGVVRVMDFGIARAAAPEGGSATGYVLGSPEYMSPEQARGLPADFRSDVYSLGVVVFEVFSGRVPFRADTPVATLLLHLEREPPLRGAGAPPFPEVLVGFLTRALAKEPGARYPTAAEAAAALRDAREGGPTERVPDPVMARRRRRTAMASGVAALVAAVVASLWWRWPRVDTPGASPSVPARAPAPVVSPTATPPATIAPEAPRSVPPSPAAEPRPTAGRTAVSREPPVRAPADDLPATPLPVAPPSPSPSLAPVPSPVPSPGALLVVVRPWADVAIDGVVVGQTPLRAIPLSPGPHSVLLSHPAFHPYPRRVTIEEGETLRLTVDLPTEGVRRR